VCQRLLLEDNQARGPSIVVRRGVGLCAERHVGSVRYGYRASSAAGIGDFQVAVGVQRERGELAVGIKPGDRKKQRNR